MTTRGRWQLGIVLLTALLRVSAAAWAEPVISNDGERYRNATDPLSTFAAWDGMGPGVLTQVVNLLPLHGAILAQTILAAALWGTAALYAASTASTRWSWPTFLAIHAWSLSPWFLLWDTWVLTETLTLAGCALAAAGGAATRAGTPRGQWVAIVGLTVAITARPFSGATLLPIVGLALIWPANRARLRTMLLPILATAALGLFATWQVFAWSNAPSPNFAYLPEPESLKQIQATDRFATRASLPGYLDLARENGMPPCPEAEAAVFEPAAFTQILGELRDITDCQDFDSWLADGGLPWTHEFTHNTSATVRELVSPDYWLRGTFVADAFVEDRMFYVRSLAPTRWDETILVINAAMLGATAVASIAALVLARGRRAFFAASVAVVTAVSVYAWGTDGIEYWRHLLPAFPVLLPLAVTLTTAARRPQA